jgi:hypothetical protein
MRFVFNEDPGLPGQLLAQLFRPPVNLGTRTRPATRPLEPVIPEYVADADVGDARGDVAERTPGDYDERVLGCDTYEQLLRRSR